MSLRQLVAAGCCLVSVSAMAQSFDINLSNDAAMLSYTSALGQQGFGHGQLDAAILFTDHTKAGFSHKGVVIGKQDGGIQLAVTKTLLAEC